MILIALALATASPATLPATLAAAQPGDTITLAPGSYGMVTVPPRVYSPPVIFTATGATIAGLRINGVDGVIWRGGTISAPGGAGTATAPPKSDAGYGVTVYASHNVRIEAIKATNARLGVIIGGSFNVVLAGSTFTGIGEDDIRATYNDGLVVVGNSIGDPAPLYTGAHPDALQAYSNKNLVIAYNTVSGSFQGIDDFGGTTDPFNDGVLVIGNTVRIANYFHSITFTSSNNVTLIGNDVGAMAGWARKTPIRAPVGAMQCGNVDQTAPVTLARVVC